MLRFEEFGTKPLNLFRDEQSNLWQVLPAPENPEGVPEGEALEAFLSQEIYPIPTKFANDIDENPWRSQIESWLGRTLESPPAEGRPPGLGWSHQRWEEFKPEVYFQTATSGARTNGGFRDNKQDHGYDKGEFGPGGLYHNTDWYYRL